LFTKATLGSIQQQAAEEAFLTPTCRKKESQKKHCPSLTWFLWKSSLILKRTYRLQIIPLVPQKQATIKMQIVVMHGWQSESTDGP